MNRMDDASWVSDEFSSLERHDKRLNKRFIEVSKAILNAPTKTLNQAMGNWTHAKAAYRLFANDKLDRDVILRAHRESILSRAKAFENEVLLAIQDSTTLNYTHHPKTSGLNTLGQQVGYDKAQQGFHVHHLLLTTEDGIPLGLLHQTVFQNTGSKGKPKNRPIIEKKSHRWLQGLKAAHELTQQGKKVVTVCDREADIDELLSEAEILQEYYVIRAATDRRLLEDELFMSDRLSRKAIAGYTEVTLTGNGQRQTKQINLALRIMPLTLKRPKRYTNDCPNILEQVTLNAIWATEIDCKQGTPVNWLLLTNCPVSSVAHAKKCLSWYQKRWRIEEYHKVMKSDCRAENCYLQSFDKLSKFVALISVIAYRLYWVTHYSSVFPDDPGTLVLKQHELEALYVYRKEAMPVRPPTVKEVTLMIAKLGGFLGRKNDHDPGITVIWRGWQKLQDLAQMWLAFNELKTIQTYG